VYGTLPWTPVAGAYSAAADPLAGLRGKGERKGEKRKRERETRGRKEEGNG